MNETTSFNLGDITATIVLLGFSLFIIAVIVFIVRKIKRNEKRADGRLSIELENNLLLQKRIDDLDDRVVALEKMLREVE